MIDETNLPQDYWLTPFTAAYAQERQVRAQAKAACRLTLKFAADHIASPSGFTVKYIADLRLYFRGDGDKKMVPFIKCLKESGLMHPLAAAAFRSTMAPLLQASSQSTDLPAGTADGSGIKLYDLLPQISDLLLAHGLLQPSRREALRAQIVRYSAFLEYCGLPESPQSEEWWYRHNGLRALPQTLNICLLKLSLTIFRMHKVGRQASRSDLAGVILRDHSKGCLVQLAFPSWYQAVAADFAEWARHGGWPASTISKSLSVMHQLAVFVTHVDAEAADFTSVTPAVTAEYAAFARKFYGETVYASEKHFYLKLCIAYAMTRFNFTLEHLRGVDAELYAVIMACGSQAQDDPAALLRLRRKQFKERLQVPAWCFADYHYFVEKSGLGSSSRAYLKRFLLYLDKHCTGYASIKIEHIFACKLLRAGRPAPAAAKFLWFLAGRNRIKPLIAAAWNYSFAVKALTIDQVELPEESELQGFSAEELFARSAEIERLMLKLGYKPGYCSFMKYAAQELALFLHRYELPFSFHAAFKWCRAYRLHNRFYVSSIGFYAAERLMRHLDFTLKDFKAYRALCCELNSPKDLPLAEEFADFLSWRRSLRVSSATIQADRGAGRRFQRFLKEQGCTGTEGLSVELIKQYCLSYNAGCTVESQGYYCSKLRTFLLFLAMQTGSVQFYRLVFSIPDINISKPGPQEMLDAEQLQAVYDFCRPDEGSTSAELRVMLILRLALQLKLRASDIGAIQLKQIDFHKRTLAVTQQKTGKFIRLPLPEAVFNLLLRYIKAHRSLYHGADSYLIQRLCMPLVPEPLTISSATIAAPFAETKTPSMHALRRTGASLMSHAAVPADMIAEHLGHDGLNNISEYIKASDEMMRQCPLSAEDLMYEGAWP